MNNNLQIFNNPEFGNIRTMERNGEPWFVGKDVATALGYDRGAKAVQDHVDDEDMDAVPIQDSIGRMQNTPIINESGLYSLVLCSKLPSAKKFKRWITSEVLPALRKTGSYQANHMTAAQMFAMQAQINLEQEHRMKALEEKAQATQQTMKEAFSALSYPTVSRDHWQDETRQKIRRICFENGLNYQQFTAQTYEELEAEARVKLETRVNNQRERMKEGGAKYAERQAVNKLTVIAADPKLRAIFSAIIQRHYAQAVTEKLSKVQEDGRYDN